jgi:hypothetical protein
MPDEDVSFSVNLYKLRNGIVVDTIHIDGYGVLKELLEDMDDMLDAKKWDNNDG